ncbi:hypothetical protein KY285_030798 [Solanum tuberosum]|nr:hypothetical protein KY285_030798 [Solanum tuberosum]
MEPFFVIFQLPSYDSLSSPMKTLEFVKDLVDGDEFHVYVVHEVDELEELPAPTGLLPWSDPVDEFVGINTEGTVQNDSDLNGVDTKLPGGEAGVDKGFEDIGINKKDRYVGRLGGDEKYIDSSECDSDDSTDMLDAEAVDLPGRRKSKKVRYDDQCTVAIFELGMIFENAKKFRKALAKYVVEKYYQIKLRPNEAHRVGVHTSQPASHSSQFTAGQSSQGSCHPEPTSSFQPGPTRFNQPASTTSNSHASSTTVCGDTNRTKQTAGQKRGRVATGEDSARGGPKRPTNGGSSNVGFGIYTSASGTQILNDASLTGIDLDFKPRGLRWKNKDAVTTSQLQQMANKKKK